MIMSTTMLASDSGWKILAAVPGLSGTPMRVTFASFLSAVTPLTSTASICFSSGTTHVPSLWLKLERTWILHAVFHAELDRADLQHLGAERRQLEHLLVADALDLARVGHDVRVGGVDAVDVGVDLADVGLERGGDGHAAGVGAAAAERGDVAVGVGALKAGDDGDLALLERVVDLLAVDRLDARAREGRVGDDAHLRAEERLRRAARLLDGERHQAHRDLLARRRDDVELALVLGRGLVVHLLGELEQAIGLARHRRDDHDDVVTRLLRGDAAPGDFADALDRADRGAAVLLHHEHGTGTILRSGAVRQGSVTAM